MFGGAADTTPSFNQAAYATVGGIQAEGSWNEVDELVFNRCFDGFILFEVSSID